MIASISGNITAKGDRFLIVETGGVGYRVYVPHATLSSAKVGITVRFLTHHHVSETANDLYGLPSKEALDFFESLLSISGIGPKTALNVLSVASIDELREAIQRADPTLLTKVSGIGKKTAERIVLELKEKVDAEASAGEGTLKEDAEVLDALVALGYTRKEARQAVQAIPKDVQGVSERVREALKHTGGHGGS